MALKALKALKAVKAPVSVRVADYTFFSPVTAPDIIGH